MNENVFEIFKSNNELFALYNVLIRKLNNLPKLIIKKRNSYLKTVIFCNRKNFACISLLDDNYSLMDKGFRIIFHMNEEIKNNRVQTVPEHQPKDFVYYVTIKTKSDIDMQLLDWLKQAYDNAK